jgi:hypothetical protein
MCVAHPSRVFLAKQKLNFIIDGKESTNEAMLFLFFIYYYFFLSFMKALYILLLSVTHTHD